MTPSVTYIDEAVVEEEAEDGRPHSRLAGDLVRHHRPHDALHVWTRLVVVPCREMVAIGSGRDNNEEEQGKCNPGKAHGRRHGYR